MVKEDNYAIEVRAEKDARRADGRQDSQEWLEESHPEPATLVRTSVRFRQRNDVIGLGGSGRMSFGVPVFGCKYYCFGFLCRRLEKAHTTAPNRGFTRIRIFRMMIIDES